MKQKRRKGGMSKNAIGLIEYVLTSEPQTVNEILEAMFEKGQEYVDSNALSWSSTFPLPLTKLKQRIPTRNELKHWLARQPHIESASFDTWTNEVATSRKRPNTQLKYWRIRRRRI